MIGKMQTVNAGVTIATAASTVLGEISGCQGAEYILLSFRAGSNVANALTAITATGLKATGLTPTGTGIQMTSSGLPKTDGLSTGANYAVLFFEDANHQHMPIPFPFVRAAAQMATADSVSVIVEAWPVFAFVAGSPKLDLNGSV